MLLHRLRDLPPESLLPAGWIVEQLEAEHGGEPAAAEPAEVDPGGVGGWRVLLWTCPDDVRLGVQELTEATGRSADWIYRVTSKKAGDDRLPCRKLDGQLVFRAGDVRRWLEDREEILAGRHPLRLARP